jgi:cell division protein ZapE
MPAELAARLGVCRHVIELHRIALAGEPSVPVPGIGRVGKHQQRAVHWGDFDRVILEVVGPAQETEASFVLSKNVGGGVQIQQYRDALGRRVHVDVAVAFVGTASQGDHGGRTRKVQIESVGDRLAQLRPFHCIHQCLGVRPECERIDRERAAFVQRRHVREDAAQTVWGDKIRHHHVGEGVAGHRRGAQRVIIELDHALLLSTDRAALNPGDGHAICGTDMDNPGADTPAQRGPLPAFRAMVAAGELAPDASQERVAARLHELWDRLRSYDPTPRNGSLFARLLRSQPPAPDGLYIVGEVGRGKSMLMDLFFAAATVRRKQRIHFHRFMQNVHLRFHAFKSAHPEIEDPIPPLADSIATEATLLCFDEFQVNDIADAMILGRLFQALFERGVVVVATSNIAPDDLFKGQPGRDAFLPFIALIKQRLDVVMMDAGRDFRRERMRGMRTWLVPADARADHELDRAFAELTNGAAGKSETLWVMGHKFVVPLAAEGVARFDFETLCGAALGAGDYLALATRYHTLILDAVPRLSPDNYDKARRFIILIDTLYDHRVKLIASADAMPDQLYQHGENAKMFERTASRLDEMRSQDWLELDHIQ